MTLNVGVTCGILRIPAIYQLPKAGHAGLRRNWNLPYNVTVLCCNFWVT